MNITFAAAQYAWLLAAILPCVIIVQAWMWRKNTRVVRDFMPPSQRIQERPKTLRQAVVMLVLDVLLTALLVLGMMQPERTITVYVPMYDHASTVFAIDVSPSIGAEGGYFGEEGRLGAIKTTFLEMISAEKDLTTSFWNMLTGKQAASGRIMEGQRIGIVGFAGEAFTKMPPTNRQSVLQNAFKQLSPNLPVVPGTNFPAAIEESLTHFTEQDTVRTIILLTDGEEEEGKAVPIAAALQKAIDAKARIFSIVVGHERALVPGKDDLWTEPAFEKDASGNIIGVKHDSVPETIATHTGGKSFLFQERGKLNAILDEIFADVAEASKQPQEERNNLQPWVAATWLLLALVRLLVQFTMQGERPFIASRPA